MAAVLAGYLVLVAPIPSLAGSLGQFVRPIAFFAIPLAVLAFVTPKHWTAIFRRFRRRDIKWVVGFAVLNLVLSFVVALVVLNLSGAKANPAVHGLADLSAPERVLFYAKTIPQLFGEEVLSILPFLALLTLFTAWMNLSRKSSIIAAWLLSAAIFGAAHLPTYDWNLVQCFVIIGSARLVLTLPYIMTKNIWVSTGAHILNDWTTFTLSILGAGVTAAA